MDNQTALTPLSTDEKPAIIPVKEMELWYKSMSKFANDILRENMDYGVIPGTQKKSLWKAGAEKLRMAFGLTVRLQLIDKIEKVEENYLDYTYKATIFTKGGQQIAECDGNCNTFETKYRYIWETQDTNPSKEEADRLKVKRLGRWQLDNYKKEWRWQLRIENPEPLNLKNTIMKMAQKRAFIGAILIATGASEFFTQDFDLEDLPEIDHSGPEVVIKTDNSDVVKILLERIRNSKELSELEEISEDIKSLGNSITQVSMLTLRQAYSKQRAEIKNSEKSMPNGNENANIEVNSKETIVAEAKEAKTDTIFDKTPVTPSKVNKTEKGEKK